MKKMLAGIVSIVALTSAAAAQHSNLGSLFDRYDVDPQWAQLPEGWDAFTSWVSADGEGSVVVLARAAPYVRLFTTEGEPLSAWGDDGLFMLAHSAHFAPDGSIWATDPPAHVVHQFSRDGRLLRTLGQRGVAGDDQARDAFNQPNAVGFAPNGDVYISDGYGNARVVQFSAQGEFVRVIGGRPGSGPGELQTPHGVAVDPEGRILVNDSGNQRLSIFAADGTFLSSVAVPSRGGIGVAPNGTVFVSDVNGGAISVLTDDRLVDVIKVDGRPHGLGVDPATGDVYTASTQPGTPNVTKSSAKRDAE